MSLKNELKKVREYETIIVSSICRWSHRLRRTVRRATGSNDRLHLFPLFDYGGGHGAIEAQAYRDWTTAQLQKRRLELYGMTPLAQSREGVPAYIYHGQAQPAQDESKAIEVELNWRYQHGDKSAELKEFWPSSRAAYCQRLHASTIF